MVKGVRVMNSVVMSLYKATGGRFPSHMQRAPIMLLSTTGFKSGKQRTNPVLFIVDRENLATVASAGGAERNPAWFVNLMHNPEATVTIKRETRKVRARKASPEERKRLWPLLTAAYSSYADYQNKTKREIPVVILSPS
jgi:F420H(2)-dependent quinone reductase